MRWGIAAKEGRVWAALSKIFRGEVAFPKKWKAVSSAANFTAMGGIVEDDLIHLLTEVINGASSTKQFHRRCLLWKQKARIQKEILDHKQVDSETWEAAREKWIHACGDAFVDSWAVSLNSMGHGVRKSLPALFYQQLTVKVNQDLVMLKARPATADVSGMSLFICIYTV